MLLLWVLYHSLTHLSNTDFIVSFHALVLSLFFIRRMWYNKEYRRRETQEKQMAGRPAKSRREGKTLRVFRGRRRETQEKQMAGRRLWEGISQRMVKIVEVTGQGREATTAALAAEIWNEHYQALLGEKQIAYMLDKFQSETALRQEEGEGYRTFWIMEATAQEPSGYFMIRLNDPPGKLFLSKLYLRASSRGKGISRLVFDYLKQTAREHGLHSLWLTVNKGNPTLEIYKHYGLAVTDSVVTDIGGGYVMDDYIMELLL